MKYPRLMFDFTIEKKRSELYQNIRTFFSERGYLEVFTPTLSASLIPEPTIKNFETEFRNEFVGNRKLYLIPSPEIFMKRMIAASSGSIFQISQCFRNAEQLGEVHNPEFSMLEYYTVGYDEEDSIELTKEFLKETALAEAGESVTGEPIIMSIREAMMKYSHLDLDEAQSVEVLREEAEKRGHIIPDGESWDDTFNRIFITDVEPNLPTKRPVILKDYPKQIDCLAKQKNEFYRARWEMYINGIEVANCYREETDKQRTREYYLKEYGKLKAEREKTGEVIPSIDLSFCDIDMKESSGVAIGLDRLLMAELGKTDIEDVLPFSFKKMLDV